MRDLEVVTFGCRLNVHESEVVRANALAAGLGNAVVFNTCAVTAEAERQARQAIRRARRERPEARIVVTGCAAQIGPQTFAAMPEVDLVLGNEEKLDPRSFSRIGSGRPTSARVEVGDIMQEEECRPQPIAGIGDRVRAFLKAQTGCDHRCTFCIIPFGRGRSRSVPVEALVEQARELHEAGIGEVVLTGVDLTAYGLDLPGQPTLGGLVRRILQAAPGLPRLRLSSIDTVEADPELLRAIAEEDRLMPHFHLSLQAGDDLVLKRMKRRHLRRDSVEFCDTVRRLRPDAVFGADVIAGFPTETDEMFENTGRLIEDCGITYLHVFPFSARPGTPAARMPQVPASVVRARARDLRARGAAALRRFEEGEVGRVREALFEGSGLGRTAHFAPVRVDAPPRKGAIRPVMITGRGADGLTGRLAA